jgi:hypothetical protein
MIRENGKGVRGELVDAPGNAGLSDSNEDPGATLVLQATDCECQAIGQWLWEVLLKRRQTH